MTCRLDLNVLKLKKYGSKMEGIKDRAKINNHYEIIQGNCSEHDFYFDDDDDNGDDDEIVNNVG